MQAKAQIPLGLGQFCGGNRWLEEVACRGRGRNPTDQRFEVVVYDRIFSHAPDSQEPGRSISGFRACVDATSAAPITTPGPAREPFARILRGVLMS
ncbi:hypothetical protein OG298_43215 (plasmid) [Streptomyces sp. NBC_01005]|uniref:hypothetical protein n=1 Tax=unclassified Streptomyces TaxID=2593676 RepID=UPI002E3672D4|nr:hypothetical protein [Streptomyces sp. NBC_01362]WSW11387.1 hypothetical protein OG298_43215 [Streptomyces sp. NBC_01005]WTD00892.1 hypothetical protein OH736_43220 [Streptomyces sp. NBC_01650]